MRYADAIKLAVVSAAVGAFLTVTLPVFEAPQAMATPAIAKGRPCSTCHAGSPPSKQNLKKKK
jgi:hypothetical protein